jgi:hypothetical protein
MQSIPLGFYNFSPRGLIGIGFIPESVKDITIQTPFLIKEGEYPHCVKKF